MRPTAVRTDIEEPRAPSPAACGHRRRALENKNRQDRQCFYALLLFTLRISELYHNVIRMSTISRNFLSGKGQQQRGRVHGAQSEQRIGAEEGTGRKTSGAERAETSGETGCKDRQSETLRQGAARTAKTDSPKHRRHKTKKACGASASLFYAAAVQAACPLSKFENGKLYKV